MIRTYDFEQRSEEWNAARRGMVTASTVGRLIAVVAPESTATGCPLCGAEPGNPCSSVAQKAYRPLKTSHEARAVAAMSLPPVIKPANNDNARALTAALVAERINGWSEEPYVSYDMMRGQMAEPLARDAYAKHYGVEVQQVGLIVRDDWGFNIGYSPDGLVGDDGLIEIKSRRARIQLVSVLDDRVPAENMAQTQAGLLVSGRKWCDYVSYCGGMHLWTKRVYPDPEWQRAIVEAVRLFEANAADMIARYTAAVEGCPMTERIDYDLEIS